MQAALVAVAMYLEIYCRRRESKSSRHTTRTFVRGPHPHPDDGRVRAEPRPAAARGNAGRALGHGTWNTSLYQAERPLARSAPACRRITLSYSCLPVGTPLALSAAMYRRCANG